MSNYYGPDEDATPATMEDSPGGCNVGFGPFSCLTWIVLLVLLGIIVTSVLSLIKHFTE